MNVSELTALPLPEGVRSRHVRIATGLDMHLLEAGHTGAGAASKPLVLLLHGQFCPMEQPATLLARLCCS